MILADLHTHTKYSHGGNSPAEMYAAAQAKGLEIIGFTEHSPRPLGFDYANEYRDKLTRHLPDYAREVLEIKAANAHGPCRVLFGMEMDWLEGQEDYTRASCAAFDFDYLLGSVHFIGHWGFDDGADPWKAFSQEECEKQYQAYFEAWERMILSGLFNIAAHPDLIKIFSVEQFHIWLAKPESMALVQRCLVKDALQAGGQAGGVVRAGDEDHDGMLVHGGGQGFHDLLGIHTGQAAIQRAVIRLLRPQHYGKTNRHARGQANHKADLTQHGHLGKVFQKGQAEQRRFAVDRGGLGRNVISDCFCHDLFRP